MQRYLIVAICAGLGFFSATTTALAHGVIGKRFIPSTLTLEDPFTSDEMDLFSFGRAPRDKEGRETTFGFEFAKRLTPDLALSVGWEYIFFDPREAGERRLRDARFRS
jgi:hypothetical protein